jgi:hypothetical protein
VLFFNQYEARTSSQMRLDACADALSLFLSGARPPTNWILLAWRPAIFAASQIEWDTFRSSGERWRIAAPAGDTPKEQIIFPVLHTCNCSHGGSRRTLRKLQKPVNSIRVGFTG